MQKKLGFMSILLLMVFGSLMLPNAVFAQNTINPQPSQTSSPSPQPSQTNSPSSGSQIFPIIQVYRSSAEIAETIASRIYELNSKTENIDEQEIKVIVSDTGDSFNSILQLYSSYIELVLNLNYMVKNYVKLAGREVTISGGPEIAGITIAAEEITKAITALSQIFAVFKIETSTKNYDINLDQTAFFAQLLSALKNKISGANKVKITVYCDKFPPPDKVFHQLLESCTNYRNIAMDKKINSKLNKKDLELFDQLEKGFTELQTNLKKDNFAYNINVGGLYSRFFLTKESNKSKNNEAEKKYFAFPESDIQYAVNIKPIKAGGQERTVSGFCNTGSISFGGGSIVSFFIFDKDCNIIQADTLSAYQGYQRAKDGDGYIKE